MAYQLVSQSAVGLQPQVATVPGVTPVAAAPQQGLLSMPDFAYDSSALALDKYGTLQASDMLGSYYNQMAEKYVPVLDTFAQENAGKMVAFDPNKLMTAEDFGLGDGGGINRGSLRNRDLLQNSHNINVNSLDSLVRGGLGSSIGNGDTFKTYYINDPKRGYIPIWDTAKAEGQELFTQSERELGWVDGQPEYDYTSVGTFHRETPQEAASRLIAQGGGYRTGGGTDTNGVNDFMGETALAGIAKKDSGKWGQDFVNLPEMQQYLDDPAWVTKTDGKVTAVRAELLPYVLRESIGEEFRDIVRGSTKQADGIGSLVKAVVIGVVTSGFGTVLSAAAGGTVGGATGMAGVTAASGGAALSTTGSIMAGAAAGGMAAGLQGGNILEGAVLGGLGAASSPYISKPLANAGLTNKTLNAAATQGITGGMKSAIQGNDVMTGIVAGGITGAVNSMMPKTGAGFIDKAITGVVGNVVTGYVGQMFGNTPTAAPAAPATSSTPATTATPAPVAASNTVARQSRVII